MALATMASTVISRSVATRIAWNATGNLKVVKKLLSPCCSINLAQTANITSPAHAEKPTKVKPKPWPYDKRKYTLLWWPFDSTEKRMDENSKIIVVEGMPGTGKTEFAKTLAKELGFYYISEGTCDTHYWSDPFDADIRNLDFMMPRSSQQYDLKRFYEDKNPELGVPGRLQLDYYVARFFKHVLALKHILNTGQGVVCDRSVFGDNVYAEAMRMCGYIKPKGLAFYNRVRANTICELWKPHLTIYLDAPVDYVRDQITKRNNPIEVNSKNLSDNYLSAISQCYNEHFLPEMRKSGEVLVYDAATKEDWDVVVEDIERLELDQDPEDEAKFSDWLDLEDRELSWHRRYFSSEVHMRRLFGAMDGPWDCPEMHADQEIKLDTITAAYKHPYLEYQAAFNPKRGASLMNILLGLPSPIKK